MGKSQIVCTLIWQMIEGFRSARIVTTLQLLADLKRRYDSDEDGDAAWLVEWAAPYLLGIDEASERLDSDWSRLMLSALVDARYANMRPTILVANASPEHFAETVGDSIASRATEGGGLIVADWSSFRVTA